VLPSTTFLVLRVARGAEKYFISFCAQEPDLHTSWWCGGGARCLPLAWAEAHISTRQSFCATTTPQASCLKVACGVDLLAERGRER